MPRFSISSPTFRFVFDAFLRYRASGDNKAEVRCKYYFSRFHCFYFFFALNGSILPRHKGEMTNGQVACGGATHFFKEC